MINSQEFIYAVRWQDIIDILLISYILFRLYVLFKGTNVFRVLIGIVLLGLFQKVASYLGLIITGSALQAFTAMAAIIIIVIFRNEIRFVLQTRNFKGLFWGESREALETPVDIIVDTVFDLARKGTGALLVIPGREDISDRVHSGLVWEGIITKEMLLSIFWKDNPVHDGAAVIMENRITQVGTILPLSRRKDLPSYYGTRHRAGAGLAESTDALVIIVSEERNNVVCARGTMMHRTGTRNDLAEIINDHLGIQDEKKQVFSRENLKLFAAALISLLFVTGIWLSYTKGVDTLITVEGQVKYENRNQDLEVVSTSVKTVSLDLSGSGALLSKLTPGSAKVSIDLSKGEIGKNIIPISSQNTSLPPGVVLRNANPSFVEVTLDKFVKKKLPVQVEWEGKLGEEFTITDVSITPSEAVVIGPSRMLDDISTIYTEKVSLNNIEASGKRNITLNPGGSGLRLENGSDRKYVLEYRVEKKNSQSEES